MKKIAMTLLSLTLIAGAAFAQDIVSSRISEVTLYSDEAFVKREGSIKIGKGLSRISLASPAYSIDPDSIQASVFGEGEVYSVQLKEEFLKDAPQENIKALEQKIRDKKIERQVLIDKKGVYGKKAAFLNSIVNFSGTQLPAEIKTTFPKTEDLQKMLVFLDEGFTGISRDNLALAPKIEDMDREIAALENELDTLKKTSGASKNAIEILFNSAKEQEVLIAASYLARNAYWEPVYKVEIPLDLKGGSITMLGKIRQVTGEDWAGVKLSVSNIVPLKGEGIPSLASWTLDMPRPVPVRPQAAGAMYRVAADMAMREEKAESYSAMGGGGEFDEAPEPAKTVYAESRALPLSFEYGFPEKLDIPSKDADTILPLFSKKLEGKISYFAVPKMSPLTFMLCRTASDKELIGAPLNVFFGGRFVGKTYLEEKRPGEEFDVGLGADREVKVKREKLVDKIDETFFGKVDRLTVIRNIEFKITAENLKDKAIRMKIVDGVPVSKTDKIKVENLAISPEPSKRDYQDKEGVMLWEFSVPPNGKQEITIKFNVTYPKGAPIELL